jgi:hypothetical protein
MMGIYIQLGGMVLFALVLFVIDTIEYRQKHRHTK